MTATQPSASLNREQLTLAELFRPDFPILDQLSAAGGPLIYLDHAATSQKPQQVLEAVFEKASFWRAETG